MAEDNKSVTVAKPTNNIVAQVAERIRTGDNVLIALSKDPSVDELSAAIGLTFLLDKMGKHATAIFSGAVPNAIEFLEPEKTFEANTNSLQDFIIALDKDKADHLRYKIDGDYVKVYITPYKTTIDEGDLEFSHGDFNVDLVIALDVSSAEDLDKALAEHGRIMHDASSINISTAAPGRFGDLQWSDPAASSVSEMICGLADSLKDKESLMDKPIATALLAGIVAATSRFSNERTTPGTMTVASKLMEAGADQQLISSSIPVELDAQMADAGTGMPADEPKEVVPEKNEPASVPEPVEENPEPVDNAGDASRLQIAREESAPVVEEQKPEELKIEGAPVVEEPVKVEEPEKVEERAETPVVDEKPAEAAAPVETVRETPEEQLEKIIQGMPMTESSGPLMDELREAANKDEGLLEPEHEKVLEPLDDVEKEPEKDYASLMEQELGQPAAPAPAQGNAAMQAAPSVPSTVEINGIPAIDYGQASDAGQVVSAPTLSEGVAPEAVALAAQPAAESAQAEQVAPAPVEATVVSEPVPVPVAPEPVASPLPMPDVSSEFLPPPPPPFDPSAPVGAVDFSPTPAQAAAPVAPIAPAAPEQPAEVEHSYLGSNPVMQDQVYPPQSNDPGAFQLPTPSA